MKKIPVSKRHWVTKFEAGFCGTGRIMKLWKQRVIDNCSRCETLKETSSHVLLCSCESTNSIWECKLTALEEWMKDIDTYPDLRKILLQVLDQWRRGESVSHVTNIEFESCEKVFMTQKQIGWRQLMGGCLSLEWSRAQEDYYKWLGIRRTGERWVAELIKKIWNISWDLWQDRNDILHKTEREAVLSGVASLDKAMRSIS